MYFLEGKLRFDLSYLNIDLPVFALNPLKSS